jgi:hypothetical protein
MNMILISRPQTCSWAAAALLFVVPMAGTQERRVELTFVTRPTYTSHEPVVIEIVAENPLNEPVTIGFGRTYVGELHFTLRTPRGEQRSAHPEGVPGMGGVFRVGTRRLDPRESFRWRIVLNQWFTFDELGRYRLDVRFAGPVHAESGGPVTVQRTASLDFRVTERDELALRIRCEDLMRQIAEADDPIDAYNAAMVLVAVRDPIAIEYLEQAVKAKMAPPELLIDRLEEIGNEDAIRALERLAKGDLRRDIVDAANRALARLKSRKHPSRFVA